ncbi:unnamed protein product, partial [Rotaria magnacalcarata]
AQANRAAIGHHRVVADTRNSLKGAMIVSDQKTAINTLHNAVKTNGVQKVIVQSTIDVASAKGKSNQQNNNQPRKFIQFSTLPVIQ